MVRSSLLKYLMHITLSLFLSFVFIPCFAGNIQSEDTLSKSSVTSVSEQLARGERLFYGLVYRENSQMNCAGCHNTRFSDTLNWNPDAIEISLKYLGKNVNDLKKILLNPSGEKMAQVHSSFTLTQEDIGEIKVYMDKLTTVGLLQSKPVITNRLLFIFASLLFLFSIIDLLIIKGIKKQWINIVILSGSIIYLSYALTVDAIAVGHSPDYQPDQPVKFSHKVHAGQNGTDCIYCHSSAPYSKSAGIPPENVCMNCHLLVRKGTRSGAFEIAKVLKQFESKKPIEWVRVYNLPDHVFFSHAQHVNAGGISCQKCHGVVEKMDRISQWSDLSMGWCINCHRTTNVNFKGNKFYSQYKDLADKMKRGERDSVTIGNLGGTECMKCHY
jgi:cytochrome c553